MPAKFDLGDYTTVPQLMSRFKAKFPEGSLQSDPPVFTEGGVYVRARAYRAIDDPLPGVGTAWEPIPGKTPYTRDSEVMNAETSAWGRAIRSTLEVLDATIASAEEVRNRAEDPAETMWASTLQAAKACSTYEDALAFLREREIITAPDSVKAEARAILVDKEKANDQKI